MKEKCMHYNPYKCGHCDYCNNYETIEQYNERMERLEFENRHAPNW